MDGKSVSLADDVLNRLRVRGDEQVWVDDGNARTGRDIVRGASSIASELKARGVGPHHLVEVCASTGPDFPAALLGVMMVGGCYVTDHHQPISSPYLVESSPSAKIDDSFFAFSPGNNSTIDDDASFTAVSVPPLTPFQLARSSGSSGASRHAITTYAAVANRLAWFHSQLMPPSDQVIGVHKDRQYVGSPIEILTALLYCKRGLLIDKYTLLDPDDFWRTLRTEQVTLLLSTPPVIELLLDSAADSADGGSLRLVASSAQALKSKTARRFLNRFPECDLVSMYGLSECASNVTACRVDFEHLGEGTVPLGQPIWNASVAIVDDSCAPVPPGEVGEITISGDCVGLGYADGRTPERVLSRGSTRVFKTGDLGRFGKFGLEMVGRCDNQVKVRGHKVIPEEVEHFLEGLQGVTRAAVGLLDVENPDLGMGALLVTTSAFNMAEAAAAVHANLSHSMRPSMFVEVDNIPSTLNGKTARQGVAAALRDAHSAKIRSSGVTAQTRTEDD